MDIHEKNIEKSIDLNIIGTANVTKVCKQHDIKVNLFFNKLCLSRKKRELQRDRSLYYQ